MTNHSITKHQPPQGAAHHEPWDLVEVSPLLDVRDLKSIIRRRLMLIIAIPVLCIGLALGYLFFIATPMYESSALVFVDPKFDRTFRIEDVQSAGSDLDSLNSLERAITSDSMVIRVVDQLDLRNDMGFLPRTLRKRLEKGQSISDSRLLEEIRGKRVTASLIRPTRLLNLSVLDPDPERAQKIAATFVKEFDIFLGEQKRKEAQNSELGLRQQAEAAYDRALESEKQLEEFRQSSPEFTVEQDHQLFAERLSKMGDELNVASGIVLDLQSRAETLSTIDPEREPIKVIETGRFSDLKQVADILAQRTAVKAHYTEAESQYTITHPRFQLALSQLEDIEAQVRQLATELKSSVSSSLEAASRNEELLKTRVSELQVTLSTVKSASSKFRAIQQKVETEWLVHQNLQTQIGQTALSAEKSSTIATVMSEPMVPHKPAKPSKPLTVLIAGFLGSLLSMGFVTTELFRRRPYVDGRQAEDHLNVRSVAQIPAADDPRATDQLLMSELSKVFYSPEHRHARLIHVSAVTESPDGLRTSACLASVSANHGCSTLLVSVLPAENSNALVSFVPQRSAIENLYTLTLSSDFLITPDTALQHLKVYYEKFGRIVIESTAVSQSSQVPAAFTSFSESNLLIVSLNQDTRQDALDTVNQLTRHAKAPISLIFQG
tara:strand:- start:2192 stop:4183 length:1992 start_codon:yes stop_codon:yes gene_type:complete